MASDSSEEDEDLDFDSSESLDEQLDAAMDADFEALDKEVDLNSSEEQDPAPEQDEHAKLRKWYGEHQGDSEEELEVYLNDQGKKLTDIGYRDLEAPLILFMTQEIIEALKVSKDVWHNPVLMSYIKYKYLPFNITSSQAHKVMKRAKSFSWTHCVSNGEQLKTNFKDGLPDRVYPNPHRRSALMFQAHQESHAQAAGMITRLNYRFFWYRMREDIKHYVRQCEVCQSPGTLQTADREMNSIPPLEKGKRWHLDLVGPLYPSNEQERYIAVASCTCGQLHKVARGCCFEPQGAWRGGSICLQGNHLPLPSGGDYH